MVFPLPEHLPLNPGQPCFLGLQLTSWETPGAPLDLVRCSEGAYGPAQPTTPPLPKGGDHSQGVPPAQGLVLGKSSTSEMTYLCGYLKHLSRAPHRSLALSPEPAGAGLKRVEGKVAVSPGGRTHAVLGSRAPSLLGGERTRGPGAGSAEAEPGTARTLAAGAPGPGAGAGRGRALGPRPAGPSPGGRRRRPGRLPHALRPPVSPARPMSSAPLRSPTLRPHRMKKDESFLGKLGGTLARKKKAKEGECAAPACSRAGVPEPPPGHASPRAGVPAPRWDGSPPRASCPRRARAWPPPPGPARARASGLCRDHASPAGPRQGGCPARALRSPPPTPPARAGRRRDLRERA